MGPGRMLHNAFGSSKTDDLLGMVRTAQRGDADVPNLMGILKNSKEEESFL